MPLIQVEDTMRVLLPGELSEIPAFVSEVNADGRTILREVT